MKQKMVGMGKLVVAILFAFGTSNLGAQVQTKPKTIDTTKTTVKQTEAARNIMLNAADDVGPRQVNIGLPASVGGTTILENGLPVVYDYMGQTPTTVWRQDASLQSMKSLNVSQTAILASDIGVSVSTFTNKGTEKLKGSAAFSTNSFGLMRGDVGISGPIKKGFYYSGSMFVNMDPGTFRSDISNFMDQTILLKALINKKYDGGKGEIALLYKFAHNENISAKQSPYIYRSNGKVDQLNDFKIGRHAYLERTGVLPVIDPLTGRAERWDAMKDLRSISHVFDVIGSNKVGNGFLIDYTVRYQHANSGMYNPYLTSISDIKAPSANPVDKDIRYIYVDNNNEQVYSGLYQNGMMIAAPSSVKNTVMSRFSIGKKTAKHEWTLGFQEWYYNIDKATMATYSYQFEVAHNPRALRAQQFNAVSGKWMDYKDDLNGTRDHNKAMQYVDGADNKLAFIGTERWMIHPKLTAEFGMRLEWQKLNGNWYPDDRRQKDSRGYVWVSNATEKVKKEWFNTSGSVSITYKAFKQAGFLADLMYVQQGGKLSSYMGADDPGIKQSNIPCFGAGVYFNHPKVSVVSKVTAIERTNFTNNSTFNKEIDGELKTVKQTISYDVRTIGWTTDAVLYPFKGFDLHLMFQLQNPTYQNYEFEVLGDKYNNNGNVARSVSKMLIEIDPSYTWKNWRIWLSGRYFSKEYANYTNSLYFAGRWETFAGITYKYDKNVEFAINAVNLLNQSGAQGSISGTNTLQDGSSYFDRPVVGTYIRPFTIEFKTRVKF